MFFGIQPAFIITHIILQKNHQKKIDLLLLLKEKLNFSSLKKSRNLKILEISSEKNKIMWTNSSHRSYYYRSYRMAPAKLVPSIVSCQSSCCLVMFGLFLLIGGLMFRFIAGDDTPPSKEFDTPFFNSTRTEFSRTPRIIGTVMMIIGGILIGCAIVAVIIAIAYYRAYESERRNQLNSASQSQPITTEYSGPIIVGGADYPPQPIGYQYPHGYQPLAQSVVYNPTTIPNSEYNQRQQSAAFRFCGDSQPNYNNSSSLNQKV